MQQYYFLILLALVFVVLIVLPGRQRKKMQAQQQQMQESLKPGTSVMTTAGMHATVAGVGDGTVDLEIAPGVVATFERRAILQVREPAGGATAVESGTIEGGTVAGPGGTPVDEAPGSGATGTGEGPADRAH
jgi:preprotein translocase subunit YajC